MVNVIGLGYIGLPTALMLASNGIEVVGTDYNKALVDRLNDGIVTFDEDGLQNVMDRALDAGIRFTTEYQQTDTYIVSVPTPYDKFTKKVDVSYVLDAVEKVTAVAEKHAIIIIESTIAPGTIDSVVRPKLEALGLRVGDDIRIAHAPERIIPGNMIYELVHNNRTIGADDLSDGMIVKEIYSSFCKGKIAITDIKSAEMTKVIENTYRAVNIAFANELAKICRLADLDVYNIIDICNMHPRVNILNPGPGVGGHCISVDPWFIVGDYPLDANLIFEALSINQMMPNYVIQRVYDIMQAENIDSIERVGFYGLTYKENVDDVRESPTLQLIDILHRNFVKNLKVYDPFVKEDLIDNQYHNFDEFIDDIDMIVVMVKHNEIRDREFDISDKVILDCQNILNTETKYTL